jgi:hypothetical protein
VKEEFQKTLQYKNHNRKKSDTIEFSPYFPFFEHPVPNFRNCHWRNDSQIAGGLTSK